MNRLSIAARRPPPPALVRLVVAIGFAAALSGCATGPRIVHTEVTSFDAWPALPADRSYAFARTLEFQNSLELRSYEDIVRDELALRGFRLAPDPSAADLVVTLRPSVTGTSVRMNGGWADGPFRGSYGGAFGGYYGGFYGGYYGARFGWIDPYWSYGGFGGYTLDIYKRRLELDIDSRMETGKRYYEGRAESTGDSDSLPEAVPVLIHALFVDFPGNNGQTRRVDIAVDRAAAAR